MKLEVYLDNLKKLLYAQSGLTFTDDDASDENTYSWNITRAPVMNYSIDTITLTIVTTSEQQFFKLLDTTVIDKIRKIGININNLSYNTIYNRGELILSVLSECN